MPSLTASLTRLASLATLSRREREEAAGDIGCRYTPETIELCTQALDLRRKGFLKF
jgi:hypothetical protein